MAKPTLNELNQRIRDLLKVRPLPETPTLEQWLTWGLLEAIRIEQAYASHEMLWGIPCGPPEPSTTQLKGVTDVHE